jgi:hypothetical protein
MIFCNQVAKRVDDKEDDEIKEEKGLELGI